MRLRALLPAIAVAFLASPAASRADTLVGLAAANELMGVNLEYSGSKGSVYGVLGAYRGETGYEFLTNFTGYLGYRRYMGGSYNEDAYFGGVFAGDVAGSVQYNRYGAGGELGYQWVTDNLRTTLQMGIAIVGEAEGKALPPVNEVKPQALFGATVSLRFR